jgi:hypothetical protein
MNERSSGVISEIPLGKIGRLETTVGNASGNVLHR